MSKNSHMQTYQASQDWITWMENRNPEAAKQRKRKPKPNTSYLEYLEDDDFDEYSF